MTTLNFAFTRALGRTLAPGDEIVGTRLEHDSNVTPWRLAADDRGATVAPRRVRRRDRPARPSTRSSSASARGRGGSRSPARRTHSARSPTSPRSSPPRTRPAHGCSSTRCTSRRTGRSTSPRSAATRPHVAVQVVRPARRRALALARAARLAHAVQGPARARHGARALRDRDPGVRGDRGDRAAAAFLLDTGVDAIAPDEGGLLPAAARRAARAPPREGARPAGPRGPHADRLLRGRRSHADEVAAALAAERDRGLERQLLRGRGDGRARPRRRRRDPGRRLLLHVRDDVDRLLAGVHALRCVDAARRSRGPPADDRSRSWCSEARDEVRPHGVRHGSPGRRPGRGTHDHRRDHAGRPADGGPRPCGRVPGSVLGLPLLARFEPPGLAFFDLDGTRLLLGDGDLASMLYLAVDDIDATVAQFAAAGVEFEQGAHRIHRRRRSVRSAGYRGLDGLLPRLGGEPARPRRAYGHPPDRRRRGRSSCEPIRPGSARTGGVSVAGWIVLAVLAVALVVAEVGWLRASAARKARETELTDELEQERAAPKPRPPRPTSTSRRGCAPCATS